MILFWIIKKKTTYPFESRAKQYIPHNRELIKQHNVSNNKLMIGVFHNSLELSCEACFFEIANGTK